MEKTAQPFPWWALIFAVVGAVILATGKDSETLLVGAMSVLIFGGFSLIGVAGRWRRPRAVELIDGGFFLAFSVTRQLVIIAAFVLVGVGGVLIALAGDPVYGWGCVAGVAIAVASLMRTARQPKGILLSPLGVETLWRGREAIAWDDMTVVALDDGDLIIRGEGIDPLELPVAYLPLEPDEIVALLETYRDQPEARARIGTQAELLRLTA